MPLTRRKNHPALRSLRAPRPLQITPTLKRANALLRSEYAKALREVRRLRTAGSESFDDLWEQVDRIISSEPGLYLGGGHRSVQAFISSELPGETQRSVARNVLVARSFSPRDEARHGIGFLEEVALYARDLAGASTVPHAIDLDRLRIAVRTRGGKRTKPARDATVDEIRKARRELPGKKHPNRPAPPAERAIRAALSRRAVLRRIAIKTTTTEASFSAVPLGDLAAFGAAIAKVKVPIAE